MSNQIISSPNSEEFYKTLGLCEAVRVGQVVEVSGQVGWDENLEPATDYEGQVRLVFSNMISVLEKAGASSKDIVEMRLFLVPQKDMTLMQMVEKAFLIKKEMMPSNTCTATGVGVTGLVVPELMLECAATAYIPE